MCFAAYSSIDSWIWDCIPLMCLCWLSVIANYTYSGSRNIMTGPQISRKELPGWMIHHINFNVSPCHLPSKQSFQQCAAGHTGWWWQYCTLRNVFMRVSRTFGSGRTDYDSYGLSEHYCRPNCILTWCLSTQLEIESSNRMTLHITRCELCCSRSRYISG